MCNNVSPILVTTTQYIIIPLHLKQDPGNSATTDQSIRRVAWKLEKYLLGRGALSTAPNPKLQPPRSDMLLVHVLYVLYFEPVSEKI